MYSYHCVGAESMRFVPRLIKPFILSSKGDRVVTVHNRITGMTVDTLSQYDYSIPRQSQNPKTPIIYFAKHVPTAEHDNARTILAFMQEHLPHHQTKFWMKEHPSGMVVVGTDEYARDDQLDAKSLKLVVGDTLLTRIWYDEKDVSVLTEKGNFAYDYLLAINDPHTMTD